MDRVAPFGRWPSPLEARQAAAGKVSLSEICSDGQSVYWLESRPDEGGRVVFVRAEGDRVVDLSPEGVSIRSRVHEYGGGACRLVPGHERGTFAYVDQADQRVWLHHLAVEVPIALTDEPPAGERWAHGGLDASADGEWVVAVREVHRDDADSPPRRQVVALGARPGNRGESVLTQGHDFYGAPRLDAASARLAVVVWDHPDMPWDRSSLTVIPLGRAVDDATGRRQLVASGAPWEVEGGSDVSVGQPVWQTDGSLRFVSDRHGWWQPHRDSGTSDGPPATRLATVAAEFHGPDWALGQSTMARVGADGEVGANGDGGAAGEVGAADDGTGVLVARMTADGRDSLVLIGETGAGETAGAASPPRPLPQPCVSISALCRHGAGIAYIGAPLDGPSNVWTLEPQPPQLQLKPQATPPATPLRPRTSPGPSLATDDVSIPEPFSFVGRSGRRVHGIVHAPTLRGTTGPPGMLPPLVMGCHPGPTGSVGAGFDVVVQYFTSRGFAYAAVDYAGSTGYGRAYRCSLWGQWGVADSEDCVDAAHALAGQGRVDPAQMAIRGASSGGLTALNALASDEPFAVAVSWYGVTDLLALAASTHDFEAHYTDRLVGPLPECRDLYAARSPARRPAEINGSVLLLQGLDDLVVPPEQTRALHDALVGAGRRCEVRFFEGEGHGFRRAETVAACLEEELAFYQRELGL
jgi:dipeptidyl aminopeptidase/acylaminoacyl peptidase